jgi:hypothetical protein
MRAADRRCHPSTTRRWATASFLGLVSRGDAFSQRRASTTDQHRCVRLPGPRRHRPSRLHGGSRRATYGIRPFPRHRDLLPPVAGAWGPRVELRRRAAADPSPCLPSNSQRTLDTRPGGPSGTRVRSEPSDPGHLVDRSRALEPSTLPVGLRDPFTAAWTRYSGPGPAASASRSPPPICGPSIVEESR